MPKQKDLKRLVRARMQKTGEAYTAARLQLVRKREPARDLAAAAGMSDASVRNRTGRAWAEWVRLLDSEQAAGKSHREIVARLSSLGLPSWWSQMVTVGYERIRGLRERGQRRGAGYAANKSRTFPVPVERLFDAFANARRRRRWLPVKVAARSATPSKYFRMTWPDGAPVQVGFISKGASKSAAAVTHEKLPDRAAAEAVKKNWSEYFDLLAEFLS